MFDALFLFIFYFFGSANLFVLDSLTNRSHLWFIVVGAWDYECCDFEIFKWRLISLVGSKWLTRDSLFSILVCQTL